MKKILIVVDMQNDFVTGVLGTKEAKAIVPAVDKLVREFDGDIIFTRDTHDENYRNTQEGRKLPVEHCIKDTEGWKIIPELRDIADQCQVFDKPTFGSVQLAEHITRIAEKREVDAVYLCGVCTGICVISNAMLLKASVPEIPIRIVEKACACVTPESHETALAAMKTSQIEVV